MSVSDLPPIICPGCGKRFRRRPEFVGRPLPCPCGRTFVVDDVNEDDVSATATTTATAGAASAGVMHEGDGNGDAALSEDDFESPVAAAAHTRAAPPVNRTAGPPISAATTKTKTSATAKAKTKASSRNGNEDDAPAYRSPIVEALQRREDEVGDSPWRERYIPAAALLGGAAVHVLLWLAWIRGVGPALTVTAAAIATQVIVFGPAMFAALASAARWLDAGLGTLRAMLTAIAAVTLGPAAVADALFVVLLVVADFDWWMIVAGFGFHFVLTGPLIALTLRFNVAETALTLCLCFAPRIFFAFTTAAILSKMELVR